jgi:hypothetical protein
MNELMVSNLPKQLTVDCHPSSATPHLDFNIFATTTNCGQPLFGLTLTFLQPKSKLMEILSG